jgi:trehalose-6-phosphatase
VMEFARDPKNHLVLLSGHDGEWLGSHLASADPSLLDATTLVVEHGFAWRPAAGANARGSIGSSGSGGFVSTGALSSSTSLAKAFRTFQDVPAALLEWKNEVLSILQTFTERTDGSYVEKKETGMTWHYRDADPDFGVFQAKDLYGHLEIVLANTPTDILFDNKKIEVKLQRCSKAVVVERLLHDAASSGTPYDLVLCVGDDLSDESTFALLQPTGPGPHTLHVV